MADRNLNLLNTQIVLNSGSISNPDNKSSVIRNSERVRDDLLNITAYINGLVYYLNKTLTNGISYPYDAAQSGISGLTVLSNPEAITSFGDVFWLSTGENVGRPKTIKESLETIEAKLIQQQVNISLLERVDLTSLSSAINTTNQIAYKVKNNVLGADFNISTADLSYPISEYIYRLYAALFPSIDASELSTNALNFPALNFSAEVSQNDIPGCGLYLTLADELAGIKNVISSSICDPSFQVDFDQLIFDSQPTNIAEYISVLKDKIIEQSDEILTNATDIASIENQINGLQGAVTANQTTAGISEQATEAEVLAGLEFSGNNNLFLNPRTFCDSILNTDKQSFFALNTGLGAALKKATGFSVESLYENELLSSFSTYLNFDAGTGATSFVGAFGRHYTINTRDTNVNVVMSNLGVAKAGQEFRIKNSGLTGTITLNAGNGYTIDGDASIVLNAKDCVTLMFTGTSTHIILNKYVA